MNDRASKLKTTCTGLQPVNMRSYYSLRALCFVAIVLATCLPNAFGAFSLSFSGTIDGSDVILIQTNQSVWNHLYWSYPPSPVNLNGTVWNPQTSPQLTFAEPLIPSCLRDYLVSTTVHSGRDVAVAEVKDDHLLIYLTDTPNGSSYYDIEVLLTEKNPPQFSPPATLTVQGSIDGSDRLRITPGQAQWIHKYWSTPTNIFLNGVAWNPSQQTILTNAGSTTFLPAGIDLITAKLTKNAGRDTATIEIFDGYIDVVFADNPLGLTTYDLTVSFGSVPLESYQDWQMYYFCCTNCPQAQPSADPLGKGMSNTNQFFAGLNPISSASLFRIVSAVSTGANMLVTWTCGGGRTNVLQAASYLATSYSNISQNIILSGSGDITTNYLDLGAATNGPSRFYRVRLAP